MLKDSNIPNAVATVFHAQDTKGTDLGWLVGLYTRSKVAGEAIYNFEGIDFHIEEDRWQELDGKTLDFANGRFAIR